MAAPPRRGSRRRGLQQSFGFTWERPDPAGWLAGSWGRGSKALVFAVQRYSLHLQSYGRFSNPHHHQSRRGRICVRPRGGLDAWLGFPLQASTVPSGPLLHRGRRRPQGCPAGQVRGPFVGSGAPSEPGFRLVRDRDQRSLRRSEPSIHLRRSGDAFCICARRSRVVRDRFEDGFSLFFDARGRCDWVPSPGSRLQQEESRVAGRGMGAVRACGADSCRPDPVTLAVESRYNEAVHPLYRACRPSSSTRPRCSSREAAGFLHGEAEQVVGAACTEVTCVNPGEADGADLVRGDWRDGVGGPGGESRFALTKQLYDRSTSYDLGGQRDGCAPRTRWACSLVRTLRDNEADPRARGVAVVCILPGDHQAHGPAVPAHCAGRVWVRRLATRPAGRSRSGGVAASPSGSRATTGRCGAHAGQLILLVFSHNQPNARGATCICRVPGRSVGLEDLDGSFDARRSRRTLVSSQQPPGRQVGRAEGSSGAVCWRRGLHRPGGGLVQEDVRAAALVAAHPVGLQRNMRCDRI